MVGMIITVVGNTPQPYCYLWSIGGAGLLLMLLMLFLLVNIPTEVVDDIVMTEYTILHWHYYDRLPITIITTTSFLWCGGGSSSKCRSYGSSSRLLMIDA